MHGYAEMSTCAHEASALGLAVDNSKRGTCALHLTQLGCFLQKVCITVPGVRPLPEEELDRRTRAVELIRCGTSELRGIVPCFVCCQQDMQAAAVLTSHACLYL